MRRERGARLMWTRKEDMGASLALGQVPEEEQDGLRGTNAADEELTQDHILKWLDLVWRTQRGGSTSTTHDPGPEAATLLGVPSQEGRRLSGRPGSFRGLPEGITVLR